MTNFQRVSAMNTAFGNPKGNPKNIDWDRVRKQCLNIPDELGELFIALGANAADIKHVIHTLKRVAANATGEVNVTEVRDALCDIPVFSYGAQHFMGVNGDADMNAVIDGVMTRFVKNQEDLDATVKLHAAKGVLDVYHEGEFPTMVLKSGSDQPDAPKGKFLKSASYQNTVFAPI
jgi:predicted HAD superfamily Cof-like phosphohydrolase